MYALNLSDEEFEEVFFGRGRGKGRGKAKGVRSSGKGTGRQLNPRGRDGRIMKCHGNNGQCQSETHLKRDCPHETGKGSGRGSGVSSFASASSVLTYTDDYNQFLFMMTAHEADEDNQQNDESITTQPTTQPITTQPIPTQSTSTQPEVVAYNTQQIDETTLQSTTHRVSLPLLGVFLLLQLRTLLQVSAGPRSL